MRKTRLAIVVSILAAGFAWIPVTRAQQEAAGVARRSFDFETAAADNTTRPAEWTTQRFGGRAQYAYVAEGRAGGHAVAISSADGADVAWRVVVPARMYSRYRLSGWIKTENVGVTNGRGALLNIHGMDAARTPAVVGTQDWTRVEIEFDSGENDAFQINCLFGGFGQARGRALFDDVQLEMLSSRPIEPRVQIDAMKTGYPISPLIYGQFIEHLGRCIYGGIWAEMLEDRKFYYAVGARESPWKAVGGDGTVTMATEAAYVGEHTPRIQSTGAQGIAQGGLALIAGKGYAGRVILAGEASAAPVEVSLVWGEGANDRQSVRIDTLGAEFVKAPVAFKSGATTAAGRLEIVARGTGALRVGTASIMPDDNIDGLRADTLQLLKELDSPVYRWPGGNFVSGYDWHDGIGDPDKRPPRKNPAWQGVEHNDFGLHEFMDFCRKLNTEPYIAVNTGLGTVDAAAAELAYANGSADTEMGKLRAANGSPEPFRVKYWAVGNEMYGNWQLGNMPLSDYVQKHKSVVDAMRAVDPTIVAVAVGNVGRWSRTMLTDAAPQMDMMSEHFYVQERPSVTAHIGLARAQVRRIANAHREYRASIPALADKEVPVAMDEWNYWYGPHIYGELGTRYYLKDGLGIAEGMHEFYRNSDIFGMANYAQTVNVIGAIKTTKTDAALESTGQVLKMYRNHYGTIPVTVGGAPEPLDVAAAWTEDRRALTIGVVNPLGEAVELPLKINGTAITGAGKRWIVTGPDAMAYNTPGEPLKIGLVEEAVSGVSDKLSIPPLSAVLYELPVEN